MPADTPLSPAPMLSDLTTCIAVGSPPGYSETFIRAVIERLPGQRVVVTTYWQYTYNRADSLLPFPVWAILKAFRYLRRRTGAVGRISTGMVQLLTSYAYARFFQHHKVDAVLAEYGMRGVEMLQGCIAANVPLVVHFHGHDAYLDQTLAAYGTQYRPMFAYAHSIVAVSRDMEQQLIRLGAPPAKIVYNPCGVDLAHFTATHPEHAPPHFVAVGRFVEKKAPYLSLLAFQQVLRECPEARLTMIGDGVLWEACRQMVASLGMDHAVTLRGARPHAEVATLMQEARAFVQHSLHPSSGDSEGTPVAVLEAGASGLPVVATRHAGIKDVVIEGETGLLVDEGDVDGMAAHMITLARNPALAGQLGRKARAHIAAHFSMEQYLERLTAILQQAAATSPRPHKKGA